MLTHIHTYVYAYIIYWKGHNHGNERRDYYLAPLPSSRVHHAPTTLVLRQSHSYYACTTSILFLVSCH